MKMNDETIAKVNEEFKKNRFLDNDLKLNVGSSIGGCSIYKDNWEICKVEQLTEMIEQLTKMRSSIEEITGIKF